MDEPRGAGLIRDRYEALDVLGRGGQGEVWKALDHQHRRVVALKTRPVADDDQRDRILAEARILLSMRPHPNLPLVREDFFWNDGYVLVMDWVEGTDLGAVLLETGDPGLPVSSVLSWLAHAAAGIDHLHAEGIVHGDVKPANLVLTPEGRVVLVDFGISRTHDDRGLLSIGSPGYAAPEASEGELSGAADVYGLAATAVALLTGAPPTGGPPEWEGVPNAAAIERAVRRGLSVDPARRPRTATELIERLQAHLFLDLPTGVVTFLLTDIEGSTARWEDDPDEMADLIAVHDGLIAEAVESSGGRLLKTRGEGDSTFSVFTRASDAVVAAVAAQRTLRAATGLSIRMAIHTGEAETRDGDYFGRTVNRASRLRSIAHGGQVLLSSAAADLVVDALPDDTSLTDLGYHELRDLARGEQVFALTNPDLETVSLQTPPPVGETPPPSPPAVEPAEGEFLPWTPATLKSVLSTAANPAPATGDAIRHPMTSAPHPPFPPALASVRSPSFVGRGDEADHLRTAWRAARTGERRLILLAGEPGIGKTQLAIEIAYEAHSDGAIVLHGRCDDGLQVPFQPFATALRQSIEDAEAMGSVPTLGRLAGELVRLLPDVAPLALDLAPPIHADPETEQYRLFDAVSQWLHALSQDAPVVLVLDDLHWATRPTLQLLRHVFRSTESARLLMIGSYRDTEVGRGHPLSELLADLHRVPGLDRHILGGLREYDVVDLLDAFAGHSLGATGERLAHMVHALTDGNPFFVRELQRHLVEAEALVPLDDGRWAVQMPAVLRVPESVREVVGRRLSRVSEATSATLELAAVIGAEFDLDVLVAAGRLDEDAVLTALDEAVAARLVLESGPLRFRFAHNIVRATIVDELTRARRSRAHRRVAEAIEQRYAGDLDAHLTELAMHYAEAATAGDGTKAVEYATRAGDLALERLAYDEAVDCYRLANELLNTTAAPIDEQRRGRLLLALGTAQQLAGDRDANATLLEAARIAGRWRDADLLADVALAVTRTGYNPLNGVDDDRLATIEAALELAGDHDSARRALLLAHLATELSFGADHERRNQVSDDALAMARRIDDPRVLAEVLVLRSLSVVDPQAQPERLALADQQLALADELDDPVLAIQAALNGVVAAVESGDTELAVARVTRARQQVDELGHPALRWQVTVQEARLAAVAGRFDEAENLAVEALQLGQSAGHTDAALVYATQLFTIRWLQGRVRELAPLIRSFAHIAPEEPTARIGIAQTFAVEGDLDEARHWFALATDGDEPLADRIARNGAWTTFMVGAAEVSIALQDVDQAAVLVDVLNPYRADLVADRTTWGGSVAFFLGRLHAFLGHVRDAEECLREALAVHERVGSPPAVAATKFALGSLLIARHPDHGEGTALLREAAELAAPIGVVFAAPIRPPDHDTRIATAIAPAPVEDDATPIVGRDAELDRLRAAWASARGGVTRLVLVSGEPGVGKSRLLSEVASIARDDGAVVLRGHSDTGTGGPYQPFVEALSQLVASTSDDELPRLLGRLGNELARLVPAIADRLPDTSAPLQSDPDTERYRLFDAVAGWLRATSTTAPLVLVLDDLECAGRPTLQLLRHVAGSLSGQPILILGAYRDTEIGRGDPLSELLADLHRVPSVERMTLGALGADDVAALFEQQRGDPLDEQGRELALAVHRETNGNPLFAKELLRHLLHEGGAVTSELPDTVRALAMRRLERFSPTTRRVLAVASVMGDDIDLGVLGDVVALDEDELLTALDEATDAGVVRERSGPSPQYAFVHSVVRATLYDELGADDRADLHRAVGEAWERRHRARGEADLTVLTHHFTQGGGDQLRAAQYALRAGDHALQQLADDEAVELYQQALGFLDEAPDDHLRSEVLLRLGGVQRRRADPDYRATLFEAADLARRAGDSQLLVEAALANYRATFSSLGEVDNERVALLEEALAIVGDGDSAERAELLGHLAIELMFRNDFELRDRLSAEALAIARRLDDQHLLARVLSYRCDAIGHAKTFEERRRLVIEQQELAARLGDPALAILAGFDRHNLLLAERDLAEADRVLERNLDAMETGQQAMLRWVAAAARANRAFLAGDLDGTERLLAEALQLGQEAGQPDALIVYVAQLGLLRFFQGRLPEQEGLFVMTTEASPAIPTFRAGLATMYVELGHTEQAQRMLDELGEAEFSSIPEDLIWLTGVAFCAHTASRLGDRSKATPLLELLAPYSGRFIAEGPSFLGAVDRYLGLLCTLLERWTEADGYFDAALEAHNSIHAAAYAALTRLDWAKMLLARGYLPDRRRARELLQTAVDDGTRLGAMAIVRESQELLTELARPQLHRAGRAFQSPFVGRGQELAQLEQLWHKAQSGSRRLALIAGEPGIGKTRLAERLAELAHRDGATVLFGRCDDDAVVPMQPFVQVLRTLLADDVVTSEQFAPDLVRLLPELDLPDPPLAEAPSGDPGRERARLFDGIGELLDDLAAQRPVLLLLDDLQWADQPTLLTVRHLMHRNDKVDMLVVGTYRDTEVSRTHPLADVLAELRREHLFERIQLRGLTNDEVVAFIERLAGYQLDEGDQAFALALRDVAEGNPFFIEEILQHLIETGGLEFREGRWDITVQTWDELGVPEGVREVIGRRLSRLSGDGEQLLAAGAVIGRSFSVEVAGAMLGLDAAAATVAIEEAVGLRLVVEDAAAERTYLFSHGLVRETLYDELSLPRRQRLHLAAARAIETACAPDRLGEHVGALAMHLRQAGAAADPSAAVEWSVRAGDAAFRVFAYEEAAGHFEGAIAVLADFGGRDNDLERARLLERLGNLRIFTGISPDDGLRYAEEALAIYERYGDWRRAAKIHSQLGSHYATVGTSTGLDVETGIRHLLDAAAVLGHDHDRAAGYLQIGLANAMLRGLQLVETEAAADRAIEIATELDDRVLAAQGTLLRGLARFERGQPGDGGQLVEQAHAVAEAYTNPFLVLLTCWNRGYMHLAVDDPIAADAWYSLEMSTAKFIDAPRAASVLEVNHHRCLFESGRLRELEPHWRGAWAPAIADRLGADPDAARAELLAIVDEHRRGGDRWTMLWHLHLCAAALRMLEMEDDARRLLDEAMTIAVDQAAVIHDVAVRCELALVDAPNADAHVAAAAALVDDRTDFGKLPARIELARAAAAAGRGDHDGAESSFASAVGQLANGGRVWLHADALVQWARARQRRGDIAGARERSAAAADLYRRIDAAPHWLDRLP